MVGFQFFTFDISEQCAFTDAQIARHLTDSHEFFHIEILKVFFCCVNFCLLLSFYHIKKRGQAPRYPQQLKNRVTMKRFSTLFLSEVQQHRE